ncbi:MAG TPA: PAS domain S-box protein [Opitutaceae bacterium]|nr:PAS domain S-box protein [Opitutaceae bacterium]
MSTPFESDGPGRNVGARSENGPTDVSPSKQQPAERTQSSGDDFRAFVQTIDDLIIVATPEGRIIFGNAAAERKLGYTANELAELTILDLHPQELRDEAVAILSAIAQGEQRTCPLPLQRKNGSRLPVETRAWIGQWNGQRCVFGICKDLSVQQDAEQRFERLFRCNPMPMALTTLPDQRFADVNDAWLEILGYERSEVIGRATAELNLFPEPGRQRQAAVELQENGFIRNIELQVKTRDGNLRDGLFCGDLLHSQGRTYLLTVMQDITPRRRAEEALRESETRFRALIENAPDGVVQLSPQGRFLYASPTARRMFGFETTRLEEVDPFEATHPDDRDRVVAVLADILEHPDRVRIEQYRFRHANGRWIWIESTFTNLLDRPGVNSLVINFRDIHDRKLAQEALAAEATRRRILVEQSRDGIVILNQQGEVYEANLRFAEMLGYTPEEVRHLRVIDWDRSWSLSEVVEAIRQLGPEGAHFESRHWRKDGT